MAVSNTIKRGNLLAGLLTNEPVPREPPLAWSEYKPTVVIVEQLVRPSKVPARSFSDVLEMRRSRLGLERVSSEDIAELLWYALGVRGFSESGRANLPIFWTATPSVGGLGAVQIVVVSDDGGLPRLYDPVGHRWLYLNTDRKHALAENALAVSEILGASHGATLRIVGDMEKLSAAYLNSGTLFLREAGCVLAMIGLCAEWLGLAACPLGFLGNKFLPILGLPSPRFMAGGAIQITR